MTTEELLKTIRAEIERRIKLYSITNEKEQWIVNTYWSVLSFLDTMQTCKTCGFYENNCPFIRGKLIPYPNKVCKDYTYSAMKAEQEPEVDLDSKVTFECISKRVTMTIQELINYYIDRECCDVAEECGF